MPEEWTRLPEPDDMALEGGSDPANVEVKKVDFDGGGVPNIVELEMPVALMMCELEKDMPLPVALIMCELEKDMPLPVGPRKPLVSRFM